MPDVYEIVNATQLNNDLEDIADAIRAKSQGQDPLLFPSEFISEIGSIPTGASITGQTDVTCEAGETLATGDTVAIVATNGSLFGETNKYGGAIRDFSVSPDGTKLAAARASASGSMLFNISAPRKVATGSASTFTYFSGNAMGCRFSHDGKYCAYSGTSSPHIVIRNMETGTKIDNPSTLPPSTAKSMAWSPDDKYLAVPHLSGSFLTIYDTTSIPYTKIADPSTTPTGQGNCASWSPDGTRLAIAHNTSPYITVYDTTTTPYTKLSNPNTLPTGNANYCAFSPDGTKLAVVHNTSPFVTIYDTTTTPYTKITNPNTLPASTGNTCAWAPNGTMLAVGHNNSPYVSVYNTSSIPFAKLPNLIPLPTPEESSKLAYAVTFSPDSKRLFVGVGSSTSNTRPIYSYAFIGANPEMYKANNAITTYADGLKYGYSKSAVLSGYTGTAAVLFEP